MTTGMVKVPLVKLTPATTQSRMYDKIIISQNPHLTQTELNDIINTFNDLYRRKGPNPHITTALTIISLLSVFLFILYFYTITSASGELFGLFLAFLVCLICVVIRRVYTAFAMDRFAKALSDLCIKITHDFNHRNLSVRVDNELITMIENSLQTDYSDPRFRISIDVLVPISSVPLMTQLMINEISTVPINMQTNSYRYTALQDGASSFPEYHIVQLISLGCTREKAIETLYFTNGDINKAIYIIKYEHDQLPVYTP
ncbi:hypothetical protein HDV02_000689 [Globomyces sp. JEL0801]|nr:hypothetical protein HDV02_000689 [Globomyces sp. JEL0801]